MLRSRVMKKAPRARKWTLYEIILFMITTSRSISDYIESYMRLYMERKNPVFSGYCEIAQL
jgi:hypothetical protein